MWSPLTTSSRRLTNARWFLFHSLLLVSCVSPVLGAQASNGRTMCKVKRKSDQGVFVAQPDPPTNAAPSVTQTLRGTSTRQSTDATTTVLPPFDYGNQKVRGVNLGGWFMMEVGYSLFPFLP